MLSKHEITLKEYLDEQFFLFNNPSFIDDDPISIPHKFTKKEDIEIAGFLAASIAWGNRKSIINNANKMMLLLDNDPYNFIISHSPSDLKNLSSFVHRTFNGNDFMTFIQCLRQVYEDLGGLEAVFTKGKNHQEALANFPKHFLYTEVPQRTHKHVANIERGSAAKRLNMFLRWMVRKDNCGVDFGIWNKNEMSDLFIPLDVHSGNTARELGLLKRKQNDWKAVLELTEKLRSFDPNDPVKYDYALFGLSVNKKLLDLKT